MKRFGVEYSAGADADLDAACARIARDSPENAARWRMSVHGATARLATFPRRCPLAYEAATLGCEVRVLVHGAYRVLFTIEGQRVLVLAVRHGARRRLGEEE